MELLLSNNYSKIINFAKLIFDIALVIKFLLIKLFTTIKPQNHYIKN